MCAAPLGPQIGARMACLRPSAAQHHPHMLNQRCPARTGGRSIICLAHSRVEHAQFTTQSSRIHSAHAARICLFPTSCGGTERLRMLARSNELENVPDAPHRVPPPTLCLEGQRRVLGIVSEDLTPLYVMRPPAGHSLPARDRCVRSSAARCRRGGCMIILFEFCRRAALPRLDEHDRSRSTDIVLIAADRLIAL